MSKVESKMKDVLIEHSTVVNEANSDEGVWSESYLTISTQCAAITQEVANGYLEWFLGLSGNDKTAVVIDATLGKDTDERLYNYFITHIYKPTT